MREFLICLVCLCGVCGISSMISPEGGMKKYITLTVCLVTLSVMLSSIPKGCSAALPKLEENVKVEDKSEQIKEQIVQETKKKIEQTVKYDVMSKYNIENEDIEVTANIDKSDFENVVINEIHIELYGLGNMVKLTRIEYYVTEKYLLDCTAVFIEE